jgi:tryptophan synthase alpha chain
VNRIGECLARLKLENRKALVTYIVNGDPQPDITLNAMHTLVASGADIIELGVPFSDPMAEGPTIQRAHERALRHHTSLKQTFDVVGQFRLKDIQTPVVLMGYANPIERMGYKSCAEQASAAGVDGLLTVDYPPEESLKLNEDLKLKGIETIFLLAPTTTNQRIAKVAALASGFLYYVSLKGVTGAGHLDVDSVSERLQVIRSFTHLPVLVGFGIKDAASASSIGGLADGVVVGSVLVDAMGEDQTLTADQILGKLHAIVAPMRAALDALV